MAARQGEKTKFALACGLLSQYMKEKGNTLNLNLGMSEAHQRPTTLRLLPGAEVETETETEMGNNGNDMELFPQSAGFKEINPSEEKSQLTIFYGGKVLVFENYPAEKVEDLMNLARKGSSTSCNSTYMPPTSSSSSQISVTDQSTVVSATVPLPNAQIQTQKPNQAGFSDLPIMRKKSLQRFLEKRKDRLNAKAPYQQVCADKKEIVVPKKEDIEVSWLGLGPKV
ncbi:Protein TIFY 10A [Rhynchospora pubera]|uniref:Protein TIFY n=1 Tax=Rhynchospora pubera TaxID=906938 RepID=A0AAV8G287_9POAL|nr:Protein TIFY 10A [Rhynchospora pubera]KAJ4796622.1 Protein TIFY 10A [Rhynchospora pubera]